MIFRLLKTENFLQSCSWFSEFGHIDISTYKQQGAPELSLQNPNFDLLIVHSLVQLLDPLCEQGAGCLIE